MTSRHWPTTTTTTKKQETTACEKKNRKKRRDRLSDAKPAAEDPAEIVRIGDDAFTIQKVNHPSYQVKGKKIKWVADWPGCTGIKGFGIDGDTKEEVISRMVAVIQRKKEFRDLCEDIWTKRYGK
jgi:hypothetical protein